MTYSVKAYSTDKYDRSCEHFRTFKGISEAWKFVSEFLSEPNRKAIVYRHQKRRSYHCLRHITVRKIGQYSSGDSIPTRESKS